MRNREDGCQMIGGVTRFPLPDARGKNGAGAFGLQGEREKETALPEFLCRRFH